MADGKIDIHYVNNRDLILSYTYTADSDTDPKPGFGVVQTLGWKPDDPNAPKTAAATPAAGTPSTQTTDAGGSGATTPVAAVPPAPTIWTAVDDKSVTVVKAKTVFMFKLTLDPHVTDVVVKVFATPPTTGDETTLRTDEDTVALGKNILNKKSATVLKVLPGGKTQPHIVAFGAISVRKDGTTHALSSIEGSFKKDTALAKQVANSRKNLYARSQPVTFFWKVDGLDDKSTIVIETDTVSIPCTAFAGTIALADKITDVSQATRDGGMAAGATWQLNTKVGAMVMNADLRITDSAGNTQSMMINAFGDDPYPALDSFDVTSPNGTLLIPPGNVSLHYTCGTRNAKGTAIWVKVFDLADGMKEVTKFCLKQHTDPENTPADVPIESSVYQKGHVYVYQAAMYGLPSVGNSKNAPDPIWRIDGEGDFLFKSNTRLLVYSDKYDPRLTPKVSFTPFKILNMWDAKNWVPHYTGLNGTDANDAVNRTYHHLDGQLLEYMGRPYIANWFTYGKWASREAGQGINDLSAAMSALLDLIPSKWYLVGWVLSPPVIGTALTVGAWVSNHTMQFEVLWHITTDDFDPTFSHPTMAFQVLKMVLTTINITLSKPDDFRDHAWLVGLGTALAKTGADVIQDLFKNLQTMVTCLIVGNQGIYRNMAAASLVFMNAEVASEGTGPQAVKDWAATQPDDSNDLWWESSRDPQSFLFNSFTMYQQAREMFKQMDQLDQTDPLQKSKYEDLKKKRYDLMDIANIVIGCQEQMCILQAPNVFTEPTMQKLVQGQKQTMMLHDANGPGGAKRLIPLLPGGGDWTDFLQRMGLKSGSGANSIHIKDPYEPSFQEGDYVADPSQTGTIFEYFNDPNNLGGTGPKNQMMLNAPWVNNQRYPPTVNFLDIF